MSNFSDLTDEQLARELALEVQRDRWTLDWDLAHRGRKIREEQERRRVARERGCAAVRPLFGGQCPEHDPLPDDFDPGTL